MFSVANFSFVHGQHDIKKGQVCDFDERTTAKLLRAKLVSVSEQGADQKKSTATGTPSSASPVAQASLKPIVRQSKRGASKTAKPAQQPELTQQAELTTDNNEPLSA